MYETHGFTLSELQKKKLGQSLMSGTGFSCRLKHSQLHGNHKLMLTKQMKKKVNKCSGDGCGCVLKLSASALKANKRGGAINPEIVGKLANIGFDMFEEAKNADNKTTRAINSRLAKFRGNGLDAVDGVALSQDPDIQDMMSDLNMSSKKDQKVAKQRLKEIGLGSSTSGSGLNFSQSGKGGFSDFWNSFLWGFTHPIQAVELLAGEIDEAIDKPKRKEKALAKKLTDRALTRFSQDVRTQQLKNKQAGSGIKFL